MTLEATMRRGMKTEGTRINTSVLMLVVGALNVARYYSHAVPWWKPALAMLVLFGFASYAWSTRTEAKRLRQEYGDRLLELLDSTYQAITFADKNEAAAFVAALARQLHSPRADLASFEENVEIAATTDASGTTLYLSDGAMRAFETAFASPPVSRPISGRDLPPDRVAVLVGTPNQPIGRDDVLVRLDGKDPTVHRTLRLSHEV
jgi:hypothetical protein